MNVIEWITRAAMRNRQIVLTITTMLILFGVYSLFAMPRQEFPEITVRTGIVVGVYPGATSEEVEEQLTTKVENFLFSYEEIDRDKTYSISEEGMMYVFVELRSEVKDADQFWATIRHGLKELKATLPQEVLALIANNKFGDASALILTVQSDQRSYRELKEYLDILEAELRALPAVSTINRYGLQDEQINIYLDNEKLAHYGINPASLLMVLRTENAVSFAGDIDNGRISMPVHLPSRYKTESDLAQQIVYADPRGVTVRLQDVARIVREYEEPESYIQIDGKNCVIVTLEMMNGNNIVQFGRDVDAILNRVQRQLPPDVSISTIADQPGAVRESVNVFLHEFIVAILAVIAVTMVLLPFRISSVAAMTIPISIMITLGILYAVGIELHTVSLAALIVVLGMVVDNTIVIVDNYVEQLDHDIDPWTAAYQSVSQLFVPVLSATLAIIAVFVPMNLFMDGLAGDFVGPFPATIIITLGVSLLVAVLLVPIMTFGMIKTGLKASTAKKKRTTMLDRIQAIYDWSIEAAFRHKTAILLSMVLIIVLTGVVGSQLVSQFGPKMERDQFAVEIYLSTGSSLDQTAAAANDLQQVLLADPRVEHVTAFVGTSSPRFHTLYAPQMPSSDYAQLIVNTVSTRATKEIVDEYSRSYNSPIPQAHCRFKQLEFSLAVAPLEVRISGDTITDLKTTAEEVRQILRDTDGVGWIRTDFGEQRTGINLAINEDEANRLGLTKAMIGYSVAAAMEGLPLSTVWEGDYPVDVVLRQENPGRSGVESLGDIYLASPFSVTSVRTRQVATAEPDWTEGAIVRRNGVRTLTIRADMAYGYSAYTAFKLLNPRIQGLDLPDGVSVEYGGDHEMEIEYYTPFLYSLLTSIVIIFFIMLFQFKTIRLSVIVMSIVPLSFFGALAGLIIVGYPFGMTAFIGVIGLVGMVIRNGIIYLDYAEHLRRDNGASRTEAAIAAGKRRMRPIFLTAMAAAVGVIPMIISRSPLWGPLGTVICFGLLFTMAITLIQLPVLYAVMGPKRKQPDLSTGNTQAALATVVIALLLAGGLFVPTAQAQTTLTLEQCKALALENSVDVRNSAEEVEAAEHVRKRAFTNYFPAISATGAALYARDPFVEAGLEGGNLPVYDGDPTNLPNATQYAYFPGFSAAMGEEVYTSAVMAVQPVFAGGRILNGNRLASLGVDVKSELHDLTVDEILVRTEQQYWQIVSLDEKLKTIRAYETLLLDLEKQVIDAYNSGLILRNDVLKVQLKLSEVRLNQAKLNNGRELAMMAFCQFIGTAYDATLTLESRVEQATQSVVERIDHPAALEHRGEYRLLQKSVRAAELQRRMAVGESMPMLAVGVGEYYLKADDYDSIDNGVGFVTLQVPISGWWGGYHAIEEHRNRERIARNNQRNAEDLLLLQMDKAWTDVEEAHDQLQLSLLTQAQAEENLTVTRDSYDNGLVTVADLLEAQALLQEAEDRVIDARIAYRMKELHYLQATGRLH